MFPPLVAQSGGGRGPTHYLIKFATSIREGASCRHRAGVLHARRLPAVRRRPHAAARSVLGSPPARLPALPAPTARRRRADGGGGAIRRLPAPRRGGRSRCRGRHHPGRVSRTGRSVPAGVRQPSAGQRRPIVHRVPRHGSACSLRQTVPQHRAPPRPTTGRPAQASGGTSMPVGSMATWPTQLRQAV